MNYWPLLLLYINQFFFSFFCLTFTNYFDLYFYYVVIYWFVFVCFLSAKSKVLFTQVDFTACGKLWSTIYQIVQYSFTVIFTFQWSGVGCTNDCSSNDSYNHLTFLICLYHGLYCWQGIIFMHAMTNKSFIVCHLIVGHVYVEQWAIVWAIMPLRKGCSIGVRNTGIWTCVIQTSIEHSLSIPLISWIYFQPASSTYPLPIGLLLSNHTM